ncbi:MAG: hypothetical protein ACLP0J_29750 [Solirubrobacteraceae bacterium]
MLTHWVTPAVGVSLVLTAGRITLATKALHQLGGVAGTLKVGLARALGAHDRVASRAARRRDAKPAAALRRAALSTVFPLGMHAACSFVVGAVATATAITDFARVWVWVSAAVWLVVFAALSVSSRSLSPLSLQVEVRTRGSQVADHRRIVRLAALDELSGTSTKVNHQNASPITSNSRNKRCSR